MRVAFSSFKIDYVFGVLQAFSVPLDIREKLPRGWPSFNQTALCSFLLSEIPDSRLTPREAAQCDMHLAGTWTGSESFIFPFFRSTRVSNRSGRL
jgi:hypothetical protein